MATLQAGDIPPAQWNETNKALLDHLQKPLDFLKEVERILKPNGIIYINLHDAGGWKANKYQREWGA